MVPTGHEAKCNIKEKKKNNEDTKTSGKGNFHDHLTCTSGPNLSTLVGKQEQFFFFFGITD